MTTRRILLYVATPLAAALIVAIAVKGRTTATAGASSPVASDSAPATKREREQPPEVRAAKLREEAQAACGEGAWRKCENKLNHAQRLDPAGESDPRVQALRTALAKTPSDNAAPEGRGSQP
jgi:hypothetical protein